MILPFVRNLRPHRVDITFYEDHKCLKRGHKGETLIETKKQDGTGMSSSAGSTCTMG